MSVKYTCDCCDKSSGEPHYDEIVTVQKVVVMTFTEKGERTTNNSKQEFHLCKACLGYFTRLTRGDMIKEYVIWAKQKKQEKMNEQRTNGGE